MSKLQCEGWWEQQGLGRQPMEDLKLTFDDGRVFGQGSDVVGTFTLSGRIDGDKALLSKQYLGAHSVEYPGSFDGEGTFQGLWSIFGFGGKWMIRVVHDFSKPQTTSQTIQDWP